MQKHLDYFYKNYDIEDDNPLSKKNFEVMNEYGYNYEVTNKRVIDYDKKCSKVLYSDVKIRNVKGKR